MMLKGLDPVYSAIYDSFATEQLNQKGKTMSAYIFSLESSALNVAIFFTAQLLNTKSLVLTPMFDGFMMLKSHFLSLPGSYLDDLNEFIYGKLGLKVTYRLKDFPLISNDLVSTPRSNPAEVCALFLLFLKDSKQNISLKEVPKLEPTAIQVAKVRGGYS